MWRRAVACLCVTLLWAPARAHPPPPHTAGAACLQGAYIQLVEANAGWGAQEWARLFDNFRQLQVGDIVVQWSVYGERAFYRSSQFGRAPQPALETIMALADRAGMRVMVGLSHDPAYWSRIVEPDRPAYFANRLRGNRMLAAELHAAMGQHPSFAGWYISEEIDDINWRGQHERAELFSYLAELSGYLRAITPGARIGVSGFANKTDPRLLEMFWTDLLRQAPAIDNVYFQDGIGVGKLTLATLPSYYAAVAGAADATGRTMVPVVEAFRQTAGEPVSPGPFQAGPTTLKSLRQQLALAAQFGGQRVVFGIPEYLSPGGGAAARRLYRQYTGSMRRSRYADCKVSDHYRKKFTD